MLENNGEWPFASNIMKLAFHLKLELIRINSIHLKLMIKQSTHHYFSCHSTGLFILRRTGL